MIHVLGRLVNQSYLIFLLTRQAGTPYPATQNSYTFSILLYTKSYLCLPNPKLNSGIDETFRNYCQLQRKTLS